MQVDFLKQYLRSWDFIDSKAWKRNRTASKAQRKLIERKYRYNKRVAKQKTKKIIEEEVDLYYNYLEIS